MTGADGVVQGVVAAFTVNSAAAFAPPAEAGRVAVIVATPTAVPMTLTLAELEPAGMSTEGGIAAMPGFEDDSVTVVVDPTFALVCTVYVVASPTVITRLGGSIVSDRVGMLIAPFTRVRAPAGASPIVPA